LANEVPVLDYERTCRAERAGAGLDIITNCLKAERSARATLERIWPTFSGSEKSGCLGESSGIRSIGSYVELLTCLQLDKGASDLGKKWFE
jgi:hypothetical protein